MKPTATPRKMRKIRRRRREVKGAAEDGEQPAKRQRLLDHSSARFKEVLGWGSDKSHSQIYKNWREGVLIEARVLGITGNVQGGQGNWEQLCDAAERLPEFQWSLGASVLRSSRTSLKEKADVHDAVNALCIDVCKKARESWVKGVEQAQGNGSWYDLSKPHPGMTCK